MKTLDELKKLCDELRKSGTNYPFELGAELGRNPYLEYHYSFIESIN
jgi:hypothetical protein